MTHSDRFHRRDLLRATCNIGCSYAIASHYLASVACGEASSTRQPLNRYPQMMQRFFMAKMEALEAEREAKFASLTSRGDAETYVVEVRNKIAQSFGPFPEKTPLRPRITGVLVRDTYRVEKILFESRPGFLVSAHLYVPNEQELPRPGVVGTCGHDHDGKSGRLYQSFAQGLARQGYVVLIYDPIGQGERLQYPDDQLRSRVGVGVREHLLAGNQQFLVGEFLGSWRAWDGIRALDYLLTRPEVDPEHLGVTGNSGGGTMTTWLAGVESRWTMTAPSCFVTTFRHNLENELPADTEQCPPQSLALGLEHEDFLAALAPKPQVILAKEKDFFDVRGAELAFRRLQKIYRLLGHEENIALFVGPTAHGFSQENREAMYGFFGKATQNKNSSREPTLILESKEDLFCTPRGQVAPLKSKAVYEFTAERSRQLTNQRQPVPPEEIGERVKRFLRLPPRRGAPKYRIARPHSGRQRASYPGPRPFVSRYPIRTEPHIEAILYSLQKETHLSRPVPHTDEAFLYVPHQSSDAELRSEPLVAELIAAAPETNFYAVDLRGVGESQPDNCGDRSFLNPYGSDYFYAIHGIMFDRPYPAQRTHDLLATIDLLVEIGHTRIHLVGKGWGSISVTFAALLHSTVQRVTLKNNLESYAAVAEAVDYRWPLSVMLPGVLRHFDLPDCYRALERKQLRQVTPWGALAGK